MTGHLKEFSVPSHLCIGQCKTDCTTDEQQCLQPCQWSLSTVCYILSVGGCFFRLAHSIWMLFPPQKCHAPSGFLNISHIHNLRQTHASVSLRQPNERLQLTWVGRHLPPRASHLPHLHVGLDQGLASLLTQRWVNKGFCIGQVVLQDAHILENNSGGRGWTPS